MEVDVPHPNVNSAVLQDQSTQANETPKTTPVKPTNDSEYLVSGIDRNSRLERAAREMDNKWIKISIEQFFLEFLKGDYGDRAANINIDALWRKLQNNPAAKQESTLLEQFVRYFLLLQSNGMGLMQG